MKNKIILFLLITYTILLSSCGKVTENTESYSDDLYYYINGINLCYIDPHDNVSYYHCNRKNCKHDNLECPSYLVWMITKSDDTVYYVQDGDIELIGDVLFQTQIIYSYNVSTHDTEILKNICIPIENSLTNRFEYQDGNIYYYRNHITDEINTFDLYEFNLYNRKEKLIRNDSVPFACLTDDYIFYIINGDLFYTTKDDSELCQTGIKNVYMARCIENVIYFNKYDEENQKYTLYKIKDLSKSDYDMVLLDSPESLYYGIIIESEYMCYIYNADRKYEIRQLCQNGDKNILYSTNKPISSIDKISNYIIIFMEGVDGYEIESIMV